MPLSSKEINSILERKPWESYQELADDIFLTIFLQQHMTPKPELDLDQFNRAILSIVDEESFLKQKEYIRSVLNLFKREES